MITLERVTKLYPESSTLAVDNVDIEIPDGEICVVIGPSGCGKTTLMRMINRLIPITSGVISIDGRSVMDIDPIQLRRTIGYAIQQLDCRRLDRPADEPCERAPRLAGAEERLLHRFRRAVAACRTLCEGRQLELVA